jgi:hypothetical protein
MGIFAFDRVLDSFFATRILFRADTCSFKPAIEALTGKETFKVGFEKCTGTWLSNIRKSFELRKMFKCLDDYAKMIDPERKLSDLVTISE